MICPDTDFDCDNPGCRHGGCQGRRPDLPLLRALSSVHSAPRPAIDQALLAATASSAGADRGSKGNA
jgi:hypothetical protein